MEVRELQGHLAFRFGAPQPEQFPPVLDRAAEGMGSRKFNRTPLPASASRG